MIETNRKPNPHTLANHALANRALLALANRALLALALVAALGLGCRAQNSGDAPGGMPSASFTQSAASGQPGLAVSFSDQSSGAFDRRLWDFGNGSTSTDPNPSTDYPNAGTYQVSLTVTGARGSDTMRTTIEVAETPTAGFSCAPEVGFVPFASTCVSSASFAASTRWEFRNDRTGAVTVMNGAAPSMSFDEADRYTVTQIVDNGIGDTDVAVATIEAYAISITPNVPSGSPPGEVLFVADTGGLTGDLVAWIVDGMLVGNSQGVFVQLNTPGTYTVEFMFGSASPPLSGGATIEHVVGYGPPAAAFSPSIEEGPGPLEVTFADESTGQINTWSWDFGDGTTCVFPAPAGVPSNDPSVCSGSSPVHSYEAIGRYDVSLTVTGDDIDPNLPELSDSTLVADAVTVTILDPSFEEQGTASPLGGAWTTITPASATAAADPVALSDTQPGGGDAGMPTDGRKWASLDGLGTDGSEAALVVENGLRQDFLRPSTASVIEFDYALLYAEPPAGAVMDAMTATVSDGSTTVEIPSARANVASPYAGPSARYPTLDGSVTRATPVRTASLDLATAFPGASPDTVYTLTLRLTNDVNGFRSPRAYVDHIRFSEPAAPLTAQFSVPSTIVAGEPVDFVDETCPDPVALGCAVPTSWRWDFDTQFETTPPPASGSGEQNPAYTFAAAGDYDVRLLARNADQESLAQMTITVLAAPVAAPTLLASTGPTAPATLTFEDRSTSDPSDPIVAWSWDFAGWGTSTAQSPAPVVIQQAGTWAIRLTITTASGQTDTQSLEVVLD